MLGPMHSLSQGPGVELGHAGTWSGVKLANMERQVLKGVSASPSWVSWTTGFGWFLVVF